MNMLQAIVVGNLGGQPEMKYSANGSPFLRFNVASNYRVRTPEGQWQDAVEWVRCTVFGQRAESLNQHLAQGMKVTAMGRLEARPWRDNQGGVRAGLELVVSEIEFMSSRQAEEDAPAPQQRAVAPAPRPAPAPQQRRGARPTINVEYDAPLDDLPF